MSSLPSPFGVDVPKKRLDVLFDELAELCGQRNAVDGRIVDIVAEIDRDGIWGNTGCRSVAALVAWKTGGVTPQRRDRGRRRPPGGRIPAVH